MRLLSFFPKLAKPNSRLAWRFFCLLPIPLLWCGLSYFGVLQSAENAVLSLRYRFRGEVSAPVKVAYVNVDTRALQLLGERPWDRSDFAKAALVLMTEGKAKAVGFDFVFSDISFSKLVPRDKMEAGHRALGRAARDYPGVILAANYAGGQGRLLDEATRQFPYVRRGFTDRKKNDLPELPAEPIIGVYLDRTTGKLVVYGSVGLIDVDYTYDGADRPPAGWPYFHKGDVTPRWVPLYALTPNPAYYHLSVQLARFALGVEADGVRLLADKIELARADGTLATTIPLRDGQMLEANWFSKWESESHNLHESVADLLQFADALKSEDAADRTEAQAWFAKFNHAVVLIGPTDPLLQDLAPTPLDESPVPKVGLHGNLVKTIVSGLYIKRPTNAVTWGLILGLTAGVTLLVTAGGTRSMISKVAAVLALVAYVVVSLQLFADRQWVVPLVGPIGAAFTTSFAALIWQVLEEEKQKSRIKGMFGAYLAPEVVNQLVESEKEPELGGHDAVVTSYFSDIHAFSTFSEVMTSSQLGELLNEYFDACENILKAQGGSVDKYIGDAVVAMFGTPVEVKNHAFRACVATQLVQRRLAELREKWASEGEKWPPQVHALRSRIGLNTGLCMIGNMGSSTRFNYTMMGDNVNIAARMESGAKSWGVYTMCSEATKVACEQHGGDSVVFRPLGRIVVKGRTRALPIYEIVGLKEHVTEETRTCCALFASGLTRFYARDWEGAEDFFRKSEPLESYQVGKTPGVSTNPSLVYLRIVAHYRLHPPPENWDGVYVMQEK